MMILDGRIIKDKILDELKIEVSKLDIKLKLVVIQIDNDDASNIYIKQKMKMCEYVGYDFEHLKLKNDVDTSLVVDLINKLNNDISVNGIIVQLPLPDNIDTRMVVNSISPLKDVDGLTNLNNGKLFCGEYGLFSCTALGIMELLNRYNISVSGKNVVVINRSNLIGKPLSMMMLGMDATVSVCHLKTDNLLDYTKMADILITAVGVPNFINNEMIKKDAIVIDVSISNTINGICGDVSFEQVKNKVKYITPVPGGVGPMTVAMLAKNLLKAYYMQNNN